MVQTRAKLRTRLNLSEDIVRGLAPLGAGAARVDRDKRLIKGVKLLGRESVNGRIYSLEAIQDAYQRRIYEGIAVYVNHPDKPNDPRAINEKLGRIVNVQLIEGELYGDLEYLESNRDAALICEMAERMDSQLGCSHNAVGDGEDDAEGIFHVRRISEARSIDIVTEPATTAGFFEQRKRQAMPVKIKALFENSWKKYARRVTRRPRLNAYMKALVEQDEEDLMDEPAPAGVEEVPTDPDEALAGGFEAAVSAIVKKCLAGEEDSGACIKQIVKLLKAHGKLTNGADTESEDIEEEDEEEPVDKKQEAEEQRQRIKQLERENLIHRESSRLGVTVDETLMESLMDAKDDKRVKKLLEREKERAGTNKNPPRSGAGGGGDDSKKAVLEGDVSTNEGFLTALLG